MNDRPLAAARRPRAHREWAALERPIEASDEGARRPRRRQSDEPSRRGRLTRSRSRSSVAGSRCGGAIAGRAARSEAGPRRIEGGGRGRDREGDRRSHVHTRARCPGTRASCAARAASDRAAVPGCARGTVAGAMKTRRRQRGGHDSGGSALGWAARRQGQDRVAPLGSRRRAQLLAQALTGGVGDDQHVFSRRDAEAVADHAADRAIERGHHLLPKSPCRGPIGADLPREVPAPVSGHRRDYTGSSRRSSSAG